MQMRLCIIANIGHVDSIHTFVWILKLQTGSLDLLRGLGDGLPQKLRSLEPRLIEQISNEIMDVARCRQPAVIFVDEIDSSLSQRGSGSEHESSRRIKTQFLIEMEGFDSGNEQVLLIEARAWIIKNLLDKEGLFKLSTKDIDRICKLTEGYSGSD
ncbi:hypothetical protein L2E82_24910 [Cichorium intybus]|uniref:Uncharacterized protein n=1 Tax=Cichorium intybus TaxID=13427 RepID=A0ACB9E2D0_CICIN|nr:hypothetical protein L2E82_24910 [Cichorium intybus]